MLNNNFPGPLVLVILDGWGISSHKEGNAILLGKTPVYNNLLKEYPRTQLLASGKHVGLPDNQKGNSEAGHLNLGAGRIVLQDVRTIAQAILDGTFYKNSALLMAVDHLRNENEL